VGAHEGPVLGGAMGGGEGEGEGVGVGRGAWGVGGETSERTCWVLMRVGTGSRVQS
jgi:hypothetical protein